MSAEPLPGRLAVLERRLDPAARERDPAERDRRPVRDLDVAGEQRALERLLLVGLGRVEPAQLRVDPAAQQHERRREQALPARARHAKPALGRGARRLEARR